MPPSLQGACYAKCAWRLSPYRSFEPVFQPERLTFASGVPQPGAPTELSPEQLILRLRKGARRYSASAYFFFLFCRRAALFRPSQVGTDCIRLDGAGNPVIAPPPSAPPANTDGRRGHRREKEPSARALDGHTAESPCDSTFLQWSRSDAL